MNKEKKKKKKKDKKKKKASLLSFGDEEAEADVFVIKKKKKSSNDQTQELLRARKRSRAKQKLREQNAKAGNSGVIGLGPQTLGRQESHYSNLRSSPGMYTPEALAALRGNARHIQSDRQNRETPSDSAPTKVKEVTAKSDALVIQGQKGNSLRSNKDSKMIQAAREKRSRLRQLGDSYISLEKDRAEQGDTMSIGGREYMMSNADEHGGLVTEDGDDDVADYIHGHSNRIAFGEGANTKRKAVGSLLNKKSKNKKTSGINSLLHGSLNDTMEEDDEDDTEMNRFVESQIRSGGGSLKANSHRDLMAKRKASSGRVGNASNTKKLHQAPSAPISVAEIKRALQSSLQEIKADAKKKRRQLEQLRVDVNNADDTLTTLDEKLVGLNRKYLFFQETRDQFGSLLDCLKEKTQLIDGAWEELQQLRIKHSKFAEEQRALHLEDEVHDAWGDPPPSSPKLDDFGRDITMVSTHGRERRLKEREAKRAAHTSGEPEGWDTDKEEDPSSSASLQRDHTALIEDSKLIFQDVIAEFSTLDFARDKMQLFKSTYSQLYEDAYIGLSSPSVFAPYVRLQMLSWDPLSTPTFDVMPWYEKLFDFGTVEGMADDDVIPRLVEKLAVPLIVEHYSYLWFPYDPVATAKAIEIFKEASSHLLDDSAAFGLLRTGVVDRLMKEVKLHVKTPLIPTQTPYRPTPPEDEKENTRREFAKLAFSRRQWWRGLKLFTQMARWLGVDPEMDPDMIHTMNSFFKNSLVPFFSFQVQCVCISGPEKAQKELLASVGRMCSRLSAYLPTFSDALTQANSADARALSSLVKLVKEYAQMTVEHSVNSSVSAQLSMQLGLVLNKMRATLMQLS